MFKFRTMHSRLIFISIVVILLVAGYMYSDYRFVFDIKYDASRINLTNQLKNDLLEIAWHARDLAERDISVGSSEKKDYLVREIRHHMGTIDDTLNTIEKGNERPGAGPLWDETAPVFKDISYEWNRIFKPLIAGFLELPEDATEKDARAMLHDYESRIHGYSMKLDRLSGLLEGEYADKIHRHNTTRFYELLALVAVSLLVIAYLRNRIVRPLAKLKEETREIEKGHFDIAIDVPGEDEIGDLARSFNQMARNLDIAFDRNIRLVHGLNHLHNISKEIMGELKLDRLLEKIAGNACRLLSCKYAVVFLLYKDGEYEQFITSGMDARTIKHLKEKSGLPSVQGILGHVIRVKRPLRLDDISGHPLHSGFPEWHPAMKTLLAVPVILNDDVVGGLCFTGKPGDEVFTAEDEEMAVSYASVVSLSIKHARMVEQINELASFPEKNPFPVLECDLHCNVTYLNPAAEKMTRDMDISARSLVPADLQETAIGPDILQRDLSYSEKRIGGSVFGEYIHLIKDKKAIRVYFFDITDRDKAERALKKSEERLELAVRGSSIGIWDWDIVNNTLQWSDEIYRIFGLRSREFDVTYEAFLNSVHPGDREFVRDAVDRALSENIPYSIDHRIVLPDGTERVVHEQADVMSSADGRPVRMLGTVQDITERKRTEDKLERNYQVQNILNTLLHISLEEIPLKEQLERCLDVLMSVPFLPVMPKGGIFLTDSTPHTLKLEAMRGLPAVLQGMCARVPFGKCLCGRAAANRRIEFADCIDSRHDISYEGIAPHGHYSVPIISQDEALGVVVLYLQEGHIRDKQEMEFLMAAAEILAGIIERCRSKEAVLGHTVELMALADSFNVISAVQGTENIFEAICNIAVRNFDINAAWIGLLGKSPCSIKPAALSMSVNGRIINDMTASNCPFSRLTTVRTAAETRSYQVVQDVKSHPGLECRKDDALQPVCRSSMAMPLLDSDAALIGVLNICSSNPGFFTKRRLHIFTLFANYTSIAIENRLLIEGLEKTIEYRTRELTEAKLQAESANKAKTQFLANMSHELRTPLNAIIGFSNIMKNSIAGPLNDKQEEYSGYILESGQHLLSIINDILDLSKVEAGKMDIDPSNFDAGMLIEESLILFKEKALKHNIEIQVEIEPGITTINADRRKIKQVLFNLLSNAMKFTPDGGSIKVIVRPSPDTEEYMEFSVEDSGIGIHGGDHKLLFEPFQQLEAGLTNKIKGTGLGLSLCKKFIDLHGGRIWVESKRGKGSRFIFIVPFVIDNKIRTAGVD